MFTRPSPEAKTAFVGSVGVIATFIGWTKPSSDLLAGGIALLFISGLFFGLYKLFEHYNRR